jgi:lipopolysaccharide assembly outer membrane protein LptD (OstA)
MQPAAPPDGGAAGVPRAHVHVSNDTAVAVPRGVAQAADSLRALAAADSLAARRDSLENIGMPRDSGIVITTRAKPVKKGAKAPEPPYKIVADKMSGGRGPEGDVLFLEKVTITRSGTRLNSERGRYERATGMVHMEGNVRLRDSTTTITCDEASFSENQDRLDLNGNVVVVDHDATLKAPSGWYDRKNGVAQLTGGVSGREKQQRLVADQAFYQRDSMLVRARGHVVGIDDENHTQLEASAVDFDRRSKLAVATGQPLLRVRDDDGKETLLRARELRVNSETRIAEAVDSVSVERDTLRATAHYARFDDKSGHGLLLGEPRAWDGETTVTGDTLETITVRRKLERVIVRGGAKLDYAGMREANRGELSRLTGSRVDMFVSESRIDSLMAVGLAHDAYTAPAKEGKTAESNQTTGDTILVYFKDKKLDHAHVLGGAKGEYHPPVALGDTVAAKQELVSYEGRRIEFVIAKNKIVLEGDAHMNYRDMQLRAKRVEFDSQKNTLVAEGKPQLVQKGDEVEGQLMTYNLNERVGTIYQATTTYERGLYHGKEIRKASENELDVLGGSYSTCDLDPPHYHFSSRYMKIYLKDKLVAKPVVFYLRNIPVMALPFYVFPIKPGRHSGFLFPQFELGFNNTTGQFIRNGGYYWAPNDYMDFTAAGDYYQQQPAWALRTEANYKLLYAFDGHIEARFEHNDLTKTDDYTLYGTHQQTIGQHTRMSALANFVSSKEFNATSLSGQSFADRVNRYLTSNIQLTHYADWISLSAIVERRQDLDATQFLQDPDGAGPLHGPPVGTVASTPSITFTAPSLSVSLPTRALGSYALLKDHWIGKLLSPTYMTMSAQFQSLQTQQGFVSGVQHFLNADSVVDSSNVVSQTDVTRRAALSNLSLSDSRRLFGWINFAPSLFVNAAIFDHDEQGHTFAPAAVWQSGLGTSTTLYGRWPMPVRGLAMRHVLNPSASFSYAPEFPSLQYTDSLGNVHDRFQGFGGLGIFSGRKSARANFSLDQRFQFKYTNGDKIVRLDNMLAWTTSASYDFLWKEEGLEHPLSPISSGLRLQPPGYVNADLSAGFDAYSQRPLRSLNYNVTGNFTSHGAGKPQNAGIGPDPSLRATAADAEVNQFRENWNLALAYSYNGGYTGPVWLSHKLLNAVLRYQITPNWIIDYQTSYDITTHQLLMQRYNLTRQIHCWNAIFSRSFTPGGETEYFFRLGIREQKDVYYQRGTRQQSFGGIE